MKCFVKNWQTKFPKRQIHPLTVMFSLPVGVSLPLHKVLNEMNATFKGSTVRVENPKQPEKYGHKASTQSLSHTADLNWRFSQLHDIFICNHFQVTAF